MMNFRVSDIDREIIVEEAKKIFDPEIPASIYDIGLIYGAYYEDGYVVVEMTLTSPMCPEADVLPVNVNDAIVKKIPNIKVNLVWEPAWTPDRIPEHIKLDLGML